MEELLLAPVLVLRKLMEGDNLFLWKGLQIMSHRYQYRGNFPTQVCWEGFGKNRSSRGKKEWQFETMRFIMKRYT